MNIRHSALLATCVAAASIASPALSPPLPKAEQACRTLTVGSSAADNLQRPYALRYRRAPLRVCVPDDANETLRPRFA